jgi:hypothetical protein
LFAKVTFRGEIDASKELLSASLAALCPTARRIAVVFRSIDRDQANFSIRF